MSSYFVLHYNITNPQGFTQYSEKVGSVLKPYLDKELAEVLVINRNLSEKIVEGTAKSNLIIIKFQNEEILNEFYHSKEYQEVIHFRKDNSDGWAAII